MLHLRRAEIRKSMGQTEVSAIRTATRISPWTTPEERDRPSSAANFPSSARPEGNHEISRLQSTYGNQAVLRSANNGTIFAGQTGSGSGRAAPAPKQTPPPPA